MLFTPRNTEVTLGTEKGEEKAVSDKTAVSGHTSEYKIKVSIQTAQADLTFQKATLKLEHKEMQILELSKPIRRQALFI